MKNIKLTKGQLAIVDDIDYERVILKKWNAHFKGRKYYADSKDISLHRFIMNLSNGDGLEVDHRNHNPLDNRRVNLRVTTRLYNSKNRVKYNPTTSKFKGVQFRKDRNKWITVIRKDNRLHRLGSFKSEIEAALNYNKYAKKMFGEFAYLNKV